MFEQFKKYRSLTFLVSLLLLILIYPFFEGSRVNGVIFILIYTTVLLSGVYAISYDVRYIAVGILLVAPIIVCYWSNVILNDPQIDTLERACSAVFMTYALIALLQRVLTASKVGLNEIYGAICAYVLIGTVFGLIYILIETLVPGSFHFAEVSGHNHVAAMIYFSFVTLSTAGFGDIVAVSSFARSVVVIEIIIGVAYVAVLIGRLIGASQLTGKDEEQMESREDHERQLMLKDMLKTQMPLKQRPIGLVLAAVMMNFVSSALMFHFHLPFFLDSWGTSLAVILGGWQAGAAAAVLYHLLIAATFWGWSSWLWVFSSLLIAAVTWFFREKGWLTLYRPFHLIGAGMIAGFLNSLLVQALLFFAHMAPYQGTLPVYRFFLKVFGNGTFASMAEKIFVEIADKTLSLMIAAVAVFLLYDFLAQYKDKLSGKNKS